MSFQGYSSAGDEIQISCGLFAVVERYQDAVFRAAVTVTGNYSDAEDVTQEVFFKYFRLRPQFESSAHEKAWLLRVAINEGKNVVRTFWNRNRADADLSAFGYTEPEEESDVLQAVLSLPEKYRTAIYLYYYESYSVREIAGITSQTENAVSKQLSRARKILRVKLGGDKA